jgi:hypothetical protein
VDIRSGLVLAGLSTFHSNYVKSLADDYPDRYKDKFVQELTSGLLCYGADVIKPSLVKNADKLHEVARDRILQIKPFYTDNNKPLFIDSGGFQICVGKVPPSYVEYLADIYTRFIQETSNQSNMVYFYLDIIPTNGITESFAIEHMKRFHKLLMERTKESKAHENVYLVIHCNAVLSYRTFYRFIRENNIHHDLNSRKYAVGGMVPLNFNSKVYHVRPYMVALIDVIELEAENIKNKVPIYFHVLGTSSLYDMICISWLNLLLELKGYNITITFDSTSHINSASKAGIVHYINPHPDVDDPYRVTPFHIKYDELNNVMKNRKYNNRHYLELVKRDLLDTLKIVDPTDPWYDEDHKWTPSATRLFGVYEAWASSQIFDFVVQKSSEYKDCITDKAKRFKLRDLFYDFMSIFNRKSDTRNNRLTTERVMKSIILSVDYLDLALQGGLGPVHKSFGLVNTLFSQNDFLMTPYIKSITIKMPPRHTDEGGPM